MILAGDVGGTKCNLALFSERDGKLTSVFRQRFRSKDFAQFDLIAKEFARQAASHLAGEKIEAAGFGIAGPVINNRVRATNLPWMIDAAVLSQELSIQHIVLLNDLGAWGHSIEYLDPSQFCVLNQGKVEPGGTRGLLAAMKSNQRRTVQGLGFFSALKKTAINEDARLFCLDDVT